VSTGQHWIHYLNHFGYCHCVTQQSRVDVDSGRIKEICVDVSRAGHTAESHAGILGEVLDSQRQRKDPAKGREPTVVPIDEITSPDGKLIGI